MFGIRPVFGAQLSDRLTDPVAYHRRENLNDGLTSEALEALYAQRTSATEELPIVGSDGSLTLIEQPMPVPVTLIHGAVVPTSVVVDLLPTQGGLQDD